MMCIEVEMRGVSSFSFHVCCTMVAMETNFRPFCSLTSKKPEEVGRKQRSRADRSTSTVKFAESAKFFVPSQQFSQSALWSVVMNSLSTALWRFKAPIPVKGSTLP